jgi:hypothetical protein
MPTCPRCHQAVDTQAITCPRCRTALKAYGHPGISLHRATGDEPLCATCTYDVDNTCNFPQRPFARECTLYHDQRQPIDLSSQRRSTQSLQHWVERNRPFLMILGLFAVSFLIVLYQLSQQQR